MLIVHREFYDDNKSLLHECYMDEKKLTVIDKIWNSKGKLKHVLHGFENIMEGENLELMYKTKK
jgi:hypothetical protein